MEPAMELMIDLKLLVLTSIWEVIVYVVVKVHLLSRNWLNGAYQRYQFCSRKGKVKVVGSCSSHRLRHIPSLRCIWLR